MLLAVVTGGCGAEVSGRGTFGPDNAQSAPRDALRYYLAKDVLVVEGVEAYRLIGQVTATTSNNVTNFSVKKQRVFAGGRADVKVVTIADPSAFCTAEVKLGSASGDQFTIEVSDKGLLKSVNVTSESKIGDIVKNVAQAAATVAAFAAMMGQSDAEKAVQAKYDESKRGDYKAELAGASLDMLYLLHEKPEARALFAKTADLKRQIEKRREDRRKLEDTIAKASKADVEVLKGKLELIDAAIREAEAQRKATSEALDEMLRQFTKEKQIGDELKERAFSVVLELSDVPKPELISDEMPKEKVAEALDKFPKMKALFDQTGVVFTLSPYPLKNANAAAPLAADAPKGRFFYRPSYAAVLSMYGLVTTRVANGPDRKDSLRISSTKTVDLVSADAPTLSVAFESMAFADRKLQLGFDERGRLVKLDRQGTSSLAGASGALAQGLTTGRDQYAESLEKIVGIQQSQQTIQMSGITSEIEALKKKKELLDAQIALQGAQQNSGLGLQKQHLDAELAALQARLAYENARTTFDDRVEVEKLKAKLSALEQELALIKARIELGKAGKAP